MRDPHPTVACIACGKELTKLQKQRRKARFNYTQKKEGYAQIGPFCSSGCRAATSAAGDTAWAGGGTP